MADHIEGRRRMVRFLREEVLGPSRTGDRLPSDHNLVFESYDTFDAPHIQGANRNEILKKESPRKRYGAGILFPQDMIQDETKEPETAGEPIADAPEAPSDVLSEQAKKSISKSAERRGAGGASEKGTDDFALSLANQMRPSSMGLSFLADLSVKDSALEVVVRGGRYNSRKATLRIPGKTDSQRDWWFRSTFSIRARFTAASLLAADGKVKAKTPVSRNADGLSLEVAVIARPVPGAESGTERLLTAYVVNRAKVSANSPDEYCVFQVGIAAHIMGGPKDGGILPYPDRALVKADDEEQSLGLLYRNAKTFATGHGCAADWRGLPKRTGRMRMARGVAFPVVEVPSTTPDVFRDALGKDPVMVPMAPLAGLVKGDDGLAAAREVVDKYAEWILQRFADVVTLAPEYKGVANRHLAACERCHRRMEDGLKLLANDRTVRRAFSLANEAMLLQQIRSGGRDVRAPIFDEQKQTLSFGAFPNPDPLNPPSNRGKWRPFQLAFLLMCLKSVADGHDTDRETVELIWFPTGGGKTEAYLGLTAFALFLRRLRNPADDGTMVLMRYTLRLLTAQQFQRAAGLMCAMEHIRTGIPDRSLGSSRFSIGIWLGGDTTPNSRTDARKSLRALSLRDREADYNFVLLRCPWCSAVMGPTVAARHRGRPHHQANAMPPFFGLKQVNNTVVLHCPDRNCGFHNSLPVLVIDEDIYETPPSLVIGTIDKFAGLAWNDRARTIFGFGPDGTRCKSPPGLIIQDELHLITGPLGSMAGMYEILIEELCTDRRDRHPVVPKIVSSTATARRYREQIRGLYGRTDSVLFPPPGLEISDSFFASFAKRADGTLAPGRIFAGVHGTAYPSGLTASIRVFASLLQGARLLPEDQRDPWWTLLTFYNSLRELGVALTLFQGDVPERLRDICRRGEKAVQTPDGPRFPVRYLDSILELTGRISSSEVPKAISDLEVTWSPTNKPVDVCLASNIIEVGVDIDRLSLMSVMGQPKTTSQYIQVTGRVGRIWWERPGLVATVLSPAKARDRSHFERFRTYHERLYAQVEPTSVTPFTKAVLERALHAVLVGLVRQTGDQAEQRSPRPVPMALLGIARNLVMARMGVVDEKASAQVADFLNRRTQEWTKWNRDRWNPDGNAADPSLLRYSGTYYSPIWLRASWATPNSMRSVDAECRPEISTLYQDNLQMDADSAPTTDDNAAE